MKNVLLRNSVLLMLFFVAANTSCKKNSKPTPLNISGFLYTDYRGFKIGSYGDPSDDWKFSTTLTPDEINLFNFPDSVDMTSTVPVSITQIYPAYPNPAVNNLAFGGQFGTSSQFSKLKIVVVDPFLNVAFRDALLVSGSAQLVLSVNNRIKFQKKGIYRLYYSLSAKNKPDYKMGYGDFQICPGYITTPNCP